MTKPHQLSQDTIKKIEALLNEDLSSRKIADLLEISKSTVNNYRPQLNLKKKQGPKIAILDVETAATVGMFFGRFNINISQENVLKEGSWMLCASWRWLGSSEVNSVFLTPDEIQKSNDERISAVLHDVYREADAVLAHNSQGFDHKVIQMRNLANGFPALPNVKILDTLAQAKKAFKSPSNKLDNLGEYFELGRKLSTGGISLWKKVQAGDPESMMKMVKYCEQDVNLLHDLYMKIRHVGNLGSNFNAALYFDDDIPRCRTCGSAQVYPTDRIITTGKSTFREIACNNCGAVHKDSSNLTTKEKRKSLLT